MPWGIKHNRQCKEWHQQSSPVIVDENGRVVAIVHQFVNHPGLKDIAATTIAEIIVDAVNEKLSRKS